MHGAAHLTLGFALPLGAVLSLNDEIGAGVYNTLLVLVGQWALVGSAALATAVVVRRAAVGARPTETTPG